MCALQAQSKAQSISEYAIILAIFSAVILGMQTYMKRGIQGVIKMAADDIGNESQGRVEYDYKNEWIWKGGSNTTSRVLPSSYKKSEMYKEGAVRYENKEKRRQAGIQSQGLWILRDE